MYLPKLTKAVLVLLFLFLLIGGVVLAKEFLIPVAFGMLLAMLLLKKVTWLETKGCPRWLSALIGVLMVVLLVAGVIFLLGWQITDLDEEISQFNRKFAEIQRNMRQFVRHSLGISYREADDMVKGAAQKEKAPEIAAGIIAFVGGIFTNCILIVVYAFLFMFSRKHLKKFVLKLVPENNKSNVDLIMKDSVDVSYGYIAGLTKMIVCLWIMYAIGFTIVGIKHAVMFALICGTLEIVPFVGNLTGTALTIIMAIIQDGGMGMVIGIVSVYAVVQFIQTYILEPMIVGTEVNINPLFTIIAIVLGEILWGIPGMILAIPVLGITKILCDNIEELKPYGFLLGQENGKKKQTGLLDKLKKRF